MEKVIRFIAMYVGLPAAPRMPSDGRGSPSLVAKWLAANHLPPIPGRAADLLRAADLTVYRVIERRPMRSPAPGNILVWDATWGGGAGHAAVVVAANARAVVVFEQQGLPDSPPTVATHEYAGVQGWIVLPAGVP